MTHYLNFNPIYLDIIDSHYFYKELNQQSIIFLLS